ncbi:MAG: aldehyde dehydrogenase family protein, partial [Acidimicrobiia bacterium]|nr:aldehyde dehydrogenase family protein [Acidimicrobiia bacterium]
MTTLQNFVGGDWVDISGSGSTEVTNPATGDPIATHPHSDNSDVDAAIGAAKAAFHDWWMTPVPTRSAILFRYRHLVWEAQDELARIIVDENGKTFTEAKGEMLRALQYIEHAS